jgi:hypothetical protein
MKQEKHLDPPVTFDDQTFGRPGKYAFQASWSDIRRIIGYKIDMFSWDEIRMDFELVGGTVVVVTEESAGFGDLMKEVERRFPSVVGWYAKVSQPPFAECRTVLHDVAL